MTTERCENCRFYTPNKEFSYAEPRGDGECFRHPPQYFSHKYFASQPEVRRENWCGDYEKKEEER